MEWLPGDEDVWSVKLEYWVKKAITFIRLLDRAQIFKGVCRGYFPWRSYEMATGNEDVWLVELDYRLNMVITFDPTVGSRLNFYRGFQRLFSMW